MKKAAVLSEEECDKLKVVVTGEYLHEFEDVQRACGFVQPAVRIVPYDERRDTKESSDWRAQPGVDSDDQYDGAAESGHDEVDGGWAAAAAATAGYGGVHEEPGESGQQSDCGDSAELPEGVDLEWDGRDGERWERYEEDWIEFAAAVAADHPVHEDRAEQLEQEADIELLLSALQVARQFGDFGGVDCAKIFQH